ncbi:LysM domain-containing protein [Granulicella rosea]|uniref:LysM domain-containing protein n=1 Tax=Granulicella rosea TaxID=474952 RepID=A0A239D044_9BACT|nr:LysM peptidoglycan-binding domain-containing protein [Granulicella rosea]SNS25388.1 LysM domain-containing protein [Granulicella rosea]
MADFEALNNKYMPVIDKIKQFEPYGAKFVSSELDGEQLHLVAQVPSQVVANRVWNEIKSVDPVYADLKHEIATTGGAEQPYTIKSGDTLSAVAKLFYGNGNKYPEIVKANHLPDPNNVAVGKTISLPVLP